MKEYLQFVWKSLTHPTCFMDFVPAFQLAIFILFIYYMIRAIISLVKYK